MAGMDEEIRAMAIARSALAAAEKARERLRAAEQRAEVTGEIVLVARGVTLSRARMRYLDRLISN